MPKILNSRKRLRIEAKEGELDHVAPTRCLIKNSNSEQVCHILNILLHRLLDSYRNYSANENDPFIITNNANSPRFEMLPNDIFWLGAFGPTATSEDLVFHLYANNEKLDTMSWLITLCLLDKLHLRYYVRRQLAIYAFGDGGPTVDETPPFVLSCSHLIQTLFTLYSLAFKWHLDYSVPTSYLVSILPHAKEQRRQILAATITEEVFLLKNLNYNCFVTPAHITKLLDNFLTKEECLALVNETY